jgi:hypothetical protein
MKTHEHFLINLVTGLFFLSITHNLTYNHLLLMLVGGVIFDLDHILYFVLAYKTFDLNKMVLWGLREYHSMKTKIYIFHTVDFMLVLGCIAYFDRPIIYLFVGYVLHCICDWIRASYHFRKDWEGFVGWSKYWILMWNIRQNLPIPQLEDE